MFEFEPLGRLESQERSTDAHQEILPLSGPDLPMFTYCACTEPPHLRDGGQPLDLGGWHGDLARGVAATVRFGSACLSVMTGELGQI